MKKLKKWLVLIGLIISAILIILMNKWGSEDGIKNRMKRRKIKMDDLRIKEKELKDKIDSQAGNTVYLNNRLKVLRKEKREISKIVKSEIKNASSDEKAKLLKKLMKEL